MRVTKSPTSWADKAKNELKIIEEGGFSTNTSRLLRSHCDEKVLCVNPESRAVILLKHSGLIRPSIKVIHFELEEVISVTFLVSPPQVTEQVFKPQESRLASTAAAGAALGGLGGLIVGEAVSQTVNSLIHHRKNYAAYLRIRVKNRRWPIEFQHLSHLLLHTTENHHEFVAHIKKDFLPKLNDMIGFAHFAFGEKVRPPSSWFEKTFY